MPSKVMITVIEFMFLGINIFWALLRAHFNPRLTARAKMSLIESGPKHIHAREHKLYCFIIPDESWFGQPKYKTLLIKGILRCIGFCFSTHRFSFFFFFLTCQSGSRLLKVPKTFRARKAIRRTPTLLFCKAGLFIRCKGNKN